MPEHNGSYDPAAVQAAMERLREDISVDPHERFAYSQTADDVRLVLDHLADVEARAEAAEAALRHARDYCARPAGVCIPKEAPDAH